MKEEKQTLTPKLRFREFMVERGWDIRRLEQVAERITTRNSGRTYARVLTNSAEQGVLDQRDYFDREIVSAESIDTYYVVERGDYVYNPRTSAIAPVGPISRNNLGTGVMSPLYTVFRFAEDQTDFYEHYFKSTAWHPYLRQVSSTGARHDRMSITTGAFMQMPIPTPLPAEQRKIGACLTALDELLAAQSRKLDDLRAHKKGLMQQLFPRAGESRPRVRFPEFLDKGEWVNEELSSCLDAVIDYRGKAPPKSGSGVPLITARNVRFGWLDMTEDEYIPENEYESWMSKGVPRAGDILFTTEAPLANVARLPDAGRFALGQRLLALRADPAKCFHEFLFQSLLGPKMQEEINFRSTGSTAKGIKSSVFVTIGFCHPGIEEQQRIAACFGSVDALLAAASRKLNYLRAHKKGLIQQIFPSPKGE